MGVVFLAAAPVANAAPSRIARHLDAGVHRGPALSAADRGSAPLTLTPSLQQRAEQLLQESRAPEGAIVMSDVRTGRIVVWATKGRTDLVQHPIAPSASLFKVVTAAALLESGRVGLTTRQCFGGGESRIEEDDLRSDPHRDTQCTTFGEALGHSYNLVFARLAIHHLRPIALRTMAEELGFGGSLPVDVPVPAGSVVIPDDRLGLARAAAGFWNARISPLGALFLMQTIANHGERIRLSVRNGDSPPERISAGHAMRASSADALRRMLEVTVRRGTSAKAFYDVEDPRGGVLRRRVAGKTGTLIGGHPTRMYSWFAGFAPTHQPRVAIAVLLANDVHWWTKGNAVARDLLKTYFAEPPS